MLTDGDGKPVKYYPVELKNGLLSRMDQVMHYVGLLQDKIGLCESR
jgi:type VI protein secretion system component Hcp